MVGNTQGPEKATLNEPPNQSKPSGISSWVRNSFSSQSSPPPLTTPKSQRSRRDSSTVSADEALNISRANASKLNPSKIPESAVIDSPASEPKQIPSRKRSDSSKYDSLGLITAFSGGPGSF